MEIVRRALTRFPSMLNPFSKSKAEPVVRMAAERDEAPDPIWIEKVERLSELIEYRVSATCIAMLGTAILGSGLVDQSQKMTVAARAMAERKTVGHRS